MDKRDQEKSCRCRAGVIIAALLLGGGLILCGLMIKLGLVSFRSAERSVSVRGFSEKAVKADRASWRIEFTSRGSTLPNAIAEHKIAYEKLQQIVKQAGFDANEISRSTPRVEERNLDQDGNSNYQNGGKRGARFDITDAVILDTKKLEKVAALLERTSEILEQGIALTGWEQPRYYFTDLSAIKPQMISAATADARRAAERFAEDSGTKIGAIRSASQGLFSIRGAVEGSDENLQQEKVVRVVVSLDYLLVQ